MPGLPWTIIQVAVKTTVKGAAVTLASTVASCTLACYIEIGAHRLVYNCFPHKYANVAFANGLTQDQLDAVRIHSVDHTVRWVEQEEDNDEEHITELTNDNLNASTRHEPQEDKTPLNSPNLFWKEEMREETPSRPYPLVALGQQVFMVSSNDILACSMTC